MNWRNPIIRILDKHIRANDVQEKLAVIRDFYAIPVEQKASVQKDRLANLLEHAAQTVPYYRQLLTESGVWDGQTIGMSQFGAVPLLTKTILREQYQALQSDDLAQRKWSVNTSGGSTGEPVPFIQDREYKSYSHAFKRLTWEWVGKQDGDCHIKLWGSERDIIEGGMGWQATVGNFLRNLTFLNAFRMTEADVARYVQIIQRKKPKLIEAYAESIYQLARYINTQQLPKPIVGAVVATAGTLYPFMRTDIETAFACPVFNRYGSREVGDMAHECEQHRGLHINSFAHYLEILLPDGTPAPPGQVGEVVVTCLTNYAMPLIRYQIGDMAVWSEETCPCAIGTPLLAQVTGRVSDLFLTADGAQVHGEYFTHLFYHRDWVQKFQVVQETYDKIIAYIVLSASMTAQLEEIKNREMLDIVTKARLVMGEQCQVLFKFVDDIPASGSGKYRYTVSRLVDSADGIG